MHCLQRALHPLIEVAAWLRRDRRRPAALVLLAGILVLMRLALAGTANFQNGNFASNTYGGTSTVTYSAVDASDITGWTVYAGSVKLAGSAAWTSSSGSYSVDMDGVQTGAIAQPFATAAGTTYTLAFDLAGNPNCNGNSAAGVSGSSGKTKSLIVNIFDVSGNGSVYASQSYTFSTASTTTSKMGWVTEKISFTTASGTSATEVALGSQDQTNSPCGPVVANFHLYTTISGTVFEDINYGGGAGRNLSTATAAGGSAVSGARVELYNAAGSYVANTTTDTSGSYSFSNVDVNASYTVRVVNGTVTSGRAGATASLLGVQTYRTTATTGSAVAVIDHVGGENPALPDAASNTSSATLASLTTASATPQSIASVALGNAAVTGLDFGFNFDTIVNTNQNGQGSLIQWTINAGTFTDQTSLSQSGYRMVAGVKSSLPAAVETTIFMIPNGTAVAGLRSGLANQLTSGGYARISASFNGSSSLAASGDPSFKLFNNNEILDGATQTANVGDTNSGQVGTGGTVGTSATTLAQFDLPEIELDGNGVGSCVCIIGTGSAIRSIAVARQEQILVGGNSSAVSDSLVGMDAQGNSTATTTLSANYGIDIKAGSTVLIHHNYLRVNNSGVRSEVNTSNFTVEYNEITSPYNGQSSTYDGIYFPSAGSTTRIQYNLIHNLVGAAIESQHGGGTDFLVQQNTLSANGLNYGTSTASSEPAAIVICCVNNSMRPQMTLSGNVITGNAGDGIMVMKGAGYTISQNAMYGNNVGTSKGIGIDLDQTKQGNPDSMTLNGVNTNTGSTSTSYPNLGMNYPMITSAAVSGTTLTVIGYVGSASGQTAFGGATVELFKSSNSSTGYGEGQNYLGNVVAASDGTFSVKLTVPGSVSLAAGDSITATATDASGDTSEFGPNVTLVAGYVNSPSSFNAFESSTASGAVTGVIQTKTAKNWFGLDVVALNSSGGIYTGFTGTVTLAVLDASSTTGTIGANGCNPNWTQVSGSGGGSGTLPVTFTTSNAGRVSTGAALIVSDAYRNLRIQLSFTNQWGITVTSCSTDNFAVIPSLGYLSVTDNDWATAGTARTLTNGTASGGTVHKAGQPFTLSTTATNLSGATATNYNGTVTAVLTCVLPAGCGSSNLGTFTFTPTYTAGVLNTAASYSEAGAFTLQLQDTTWAAVDAADTPLASRTATSSTVTVGRFVPDHFVLSLSANGALYTFGGASCSSRSFSYIGQTIPYKSVPTVGITAQNAANAITQNYKNELWHLTAAMMSQSYADAGAGSAPSITFGSGSVSSNGNGTGSMSPNTSDTLVWARSTSAAQSPFTSQAQDTLNISDTSESASNGVITGTAAVVAQPAFDAGATMYYGRIAMGNAYGIESLNLAVPVETQYYNGTVWVTNAADSCTAIPASTFRLSNWQNNLAACQTSLSAGSTVTKGRATVTLSAPGSGKAGSVDLGINVGATAAGSACIGGASTTSTALGLPFLQGNWTGGTWNANPSARASFGDFGLVPGYRREN